MEATYILAGAFIGFVVGLTGVGSGALMTPILVIIFGVPAMTAVGTDLYFAKRTSSQLAQTFGSSNIKADCNTLLSYRRGYDCFHINRKECCC